MSACTSALASVEAVEHTIVQKRFHPLTLSPKNGFIQGQLSLKTLASNFDTFIQGQFHPMVIQSQLHPMNIRRGRLFHRMTFSSENCFVQKIHMWERHFHRKTAYTRISGFNPLSCGASPDASHEGLLKIERREFRCLRLRVQGLGFRVQVSGFRVLGLGFSSRFRVYVFRCWGVTVFWVFCFRVSVQGLRLRCLGFGV